MPLKPELKPGRWFENPRIQTWLALAIWMVPLWVISCMVFVNPEYRSVTSVYRKAVEDWWAQQNLYAGFSYHYLPQFVFLYAPFQLLPSPAGGLLWRSVSLCLLMGGLWRLLRQQFGNDAPRAFLWATLLVMPLSLGALRNGQANLLFAALTLQAVACLSLRQWSAAVVLMLLALVTKHLGLVLMGLAVLVYPPLRWRLVLGLLALAGLPFVFGSPAYVRSQYHEFFDHVPVCAAVIEHRFADLNGIIRTFGGELNGGVSTVMRALAGGVTLGVWWMGARRWTDPLRAIWLYALVTVYLMLFNPMTETNSYVIAAPAYGLWAVWALSGTETRRIGWFLAGMVLSMSLLPTVLRPLFGNGFALFWHPTMTMVFAGMLIYFRWWVIAPAEATRAKPA